MLLTHRLQDPKVGIQSLTSPGHSFQHPLLHWTHLLNILCKVNDFQTSVQERSNQVLCKHVRRLLITRDELHLNDSFRLQFPGVMKLGKDML